LRDRGNTIVVIEHNLDVIKACDWIIDLGPDGGDGGGEIVATGSPLQIAQQHDSATGYYLKRFFSKAKTTALPGTANKETASKKTAEKKTAKKKAARKKAVKKK